MYLFFKTTFYAYSTLLYLILILSYKSYNVNLSKCFTIIINSKPKHIIVKEEKYILYIYRI